MEKLNVGSIVDANLSIGHHPAIVLSTADEIAVDGKAFVVAISSNSTISLPEDLIRVPPGLDVKGFVQCGVRELLSVDQVTSRNRKAWGPFLKNVLEKVKIATEREKKSTPK